MQTWNNILSYIKRNLGTKLNILELSEEEIIEGLKDDVIPEFSQYSPDKKALRITLDDRIDSEKTGGFYTFKLNSDIPIVDIYEVYTSSSSTSIYDVFEGTKYEGSPVNHNVVGPGTTGMVGGGMIDTVIDNKFYDMVKYLSIQNTWEFYPPDKLVFDAHINGAIVLINTYHQTLDTIKPDYYNLVFKKMCFCKVIDWVIALRSKFENISSPMGELNLDINRLENKRDKLEEEYMEFLNNTPPDKLIHLF